MDLVNGNWDCLKGEVMAYSKYVSSNDAVLYFASVATHDLNKFAQTHNLSRDKVLLLEERAASAKKEAKDRGKPIFYYASEMDYMGEADILSFGADILYTGKSISASRASYMLRLGLSYYFALFEEQFNSSSFSQDYLRTKYCHYSQFSGDLHNFLLDAYASPMLEISHGTDLDSRKKLNELKKGLLDFCKETYFYEDAEMICSLIRPGEKSDEILLEEILNKIKAIHQEEFIIAAKSRDRIADLSLYLRLPASQIRTTQL